MGLIDVSPHSPGLVLAVLVHVDAFKDVYVYATLVALINVELILYHQDWCECA